MGNIHVRTDTAEIGQLDILIPPEGDLTFWEWSDLTLPPELLDKLAELGVVLELKNSSPCG